MHLTLSVLCDAASERPDGRLDITGIFDRLSAPGFPAMQERMTAVFVIEWQPDETGRQPLRADLVDDDGRKVLTIEGHTDVVAPAPGGSRARTRLILPLERVVFPQAGRYHFVLVAGSDAHQAAAIHVMHEPGADRDPAPTGRV